MRKIIIMGAFFVFMSLVIFNTLSLAVTGAEKLSVLDKDEHSKEQFQTIINILKIHHPSNTEEEIAGFIYYAYDKLKETFPDISLYEVASGILENSKILNGQADLKQIIGIYIASYQMEKIY